MADDKNADRSSLEIKGLLRKLHPDQGNHKDRVRKLSKFRSYVLVDSKGSAPEFYDDDIPLLFLGSSAPSVFLDADEDYTGLYGLLQACGTPSGDHDGTLKRSAKHAMNLLKWLLLDWKDPSQKKNDLNVFCQSFLTFAAHHYRHMQLDLHLISSNKDDRGGAKEDACQTIVLILTRHLSENGESPQPVTMDELILNPKGQQEFELWMARNTTKSVQDSIKKNTQKRESELLLQKRQDVLVSKVSKQQLEDLEDNVDSRHDHPADSAADQSEGVDEDTTTNADDDDDDVMAAFRKRKKNIMKELKDAEGRGEIASSAGVALRWEDSQLAREQRARAASAARAGHHETVRDSQEAAMEAAEREEEKSKVQSKDPLGIVTTDDFDLRDVEKSQAERMEHALQELQEEFQKAEATGVETLIKKVRAEKESLEALVDRMGGIDAMENTTNLARSVLPTSPTFDPILFLTLVHRTTSYDALIKSMERLSSTTENQVEQLQNLVRDNFPLFVRCAEGFDDFRRGAETESMGVNERVDKLEAIAESCTFQAKKSFKPLLDNTNEVRKVQSAMAVLQRVAPILQVPALMRQHVENRRFSEALKIYRRVQTVDESCNIDLLLYVRAQAEACVRDARIDLEHRLAQEKISLEELTDGIRDLGELIELGVAAERVRRDASAESDAAILETKLGVYQIGGNKINVRDHPPALSCLLLQAAHFANNMRSLIKEADETTSRLFAKESVVNVSNENEDDADVKVAKLSGSQWKYDVLDARVSSAIRAVAYIRIWLPRLVAIGHASREDERRRAARVGASRRNNASRLTAFEVLISNITPSLMLLVEHTVFCALGSSTRSGGKDVLMTFGQNTDDKLRSLLRSPLPPSQSTKVAKQLVELVSIVTQNLVGANSLRPDSSGAFQLSPLDECKSLGDFAVVAIERRRCIYAFDVCARACTTRASGSGKFDGVALVNCLKTLSDQLSRPEECSNEVEKGCELVVRRCCEGLVSYVRDRGEAARLTAVSECADVLSDKVTEIIKEAALLTPNSGRLQETVTEDILGLESVMFDEYLDSIRQTVGSSVRIGWLDETAMSSSQSESSAPSSFPAYLSASLLAIVRCRAQVEQILSTKLRIAENLQYHHLAMSTVSDGVVEGICNEISKRKLKLKVRQADRLANELEFLKNTLRRCLSESSRSQLNSVLQMVCLKAGRGRDYQGDGPDGLAALEELERLGRVYVLCLGE